MKTIKYIYLLFAIVSVATGTLTANGAPGDLFASVNGGPGNGVGSIYQYTPSGVQTIFASGLSRPRGLAFDSAGNLFVATTFVDATFHSTILKFTPDGAQELFAAIPGSFFAEGVAIDRSDNVFVMVFPGFNFLPSGTLSLIYRFTPNGVGMPFEVFHHPTQGLGLAFDSLGNLFATDFSAQTIYEVAPDGTRSIFVGPEAFGMMGNPVGLAFDTSGNLFVSVSDGFSGTILKFAQNASKSAFAAGLNSPEGLAFDSAGNLFVAENPRPFTSGDILKFTSDGMRTIFASGIAGPRFLTVQP
jgi:sugar lactone lactonase YvrE